MGNLIYSNANGVQISYELMEKTLNCGICKRLLNVSPIVFKRKMGYAICGRCQLGRRNLNKTDIFPQTLYEELASHLTYPCSYRKLGCEKILKFAMVQSHERICRTYANKGLETLDDWLQELTQIVDDRDARVRDLVSRRAVFKSKFQSVFCPLSCMQLGKRPICRWTGSAQMINDHIRQHPDLLLDPPLFVWPKIGHNKVFFTKIAQQIVTVAVKYKSEDEFLCLVSINGTDLESQSYRYQLELTSEDKLSSILLRRDRLQCLRNMSHDFKKAQNTLQVNLQKLSEMLQNSKKIFAKVSITKKSEKQIDQMIGDRISELSSSTSTLKSDDLDEDLLSELECPVCHEFMIAPIFICPTGHSLCNVCKQMIASCPMCKCDFAKGRNFTLEKLAAKVKYPCRNRNIGCKFVSTSDLIRSHEDVCMLPKSGCFYQCGSKGLLPDELAKHLKAKHKTKQIINNKAFKICIGRTGSDAFSFVDIGNQLFVVALTYSKPLQENVLFNIYYVRQTDSDQVFPYNIQFSPDFNQPCPFIRLQLSNFCDVWTPELTKNWTQKCVCIPRHLLDGCLKKFYYDYVKVNITQV